jgi:nitrite reductase/ring-hydroxylating ferredoxin subunit
MMNTVDAASTGERTEYAAGPDAGFEPGKFVIVQLGKHSVGITRLRNGDLKAVRNRCPHKGAQICRGILGGTWPPSEPGELRYDREGEVLVCPWHGYEYDLQDGRELYQEVPTRLRFFPVTIRDGTVYVTL